MPERLDPFRLEPILVERPWGGRALARYGKDLPPDGVIAESWEVADLPHDVAPHVPNPSSVIADGPLAGTTIGELVRSQPKALLGEAAPASDGGFPLLVKLLDAREHLSVQVHPSPAYVADHPETRRKTESWFVIDAVPGSRLYLGLRDGVTTDDVRNAVSEGTVEEVLHAVDAVPGGFHHLPAGLVHALGAGVLVAEIQTPSDTTFRLYDWTAEYGRPVRPLHVEEALASLDPRPAGVVSRPPIGDGSRRLVDAGDYVVTEHAIDREGISIADRSTVVVVMVVQGTARVGTTAQMPGSTIVIPASSPDVPVRGEPDARVLEIAVPPAPGS